MCCNTHQLRDQMASANREPLDLVRHDDPERCQCTHTAHCNRRMQSETLQCDWCWRYRHSEENHAGCQVISTLVRVPFIPEPPIRIPAREYAAPPFSAPEIEKAVQALRGKWRLRSRGRRPE
jgi:hypothetical protein